MSERRAVTKTLARRCRAQDRAGKKAILDELCQLTRWYREISVLLARVGPPQAKTSSSRRWPRR